MAVTSTVPAVKAALVTALAAASSLAGVQVTYGWPPNPQREHLFIGGTTDWEQEPGVFGGQGRAESYGLELTIVASKPGAAQQTVTERAFVLLAAVETVLLAAPSLGLLPTDINMLVSEMKPASLTEGLWDDGRFALIDAVIAVEGDHF